jgi:3-oxoadipate enol-lactonase
MMIPVNGGEVWAQDSGGDLPALVLLHSGVGDSRQWDPLLPLLSGRYRTVRYDVRGFGRSPRPTAPFTPMTDLIAVLDHLGLDRVGLVGCSQGGATSIDLALAQPQRVAGIVLLGPGLTGYLFAPDLDYHRKGEALIAKRDIDGLVSLVGDRWAGAGMIPAIEAELRTLVQGWLEPNDFRKPDPPAADRLEQVSVPATLMIGDLDFQPLVKLNQEMAARIPGCRVIHLPGADHYPQYRAPEAIAAAIDETLIRTGPQ